MPPQQKRTFLPYGRGINPEHLRLGSLFLDRYNPNVGLASRRCQYRNDLKEQNQYEEQIKPWIGEEQKDTELSLNFQVSNDSSMAAHFSEFFKAEAKANSTVAAVLEGKAGRRLTIEDPEKFLEEEVFPQERAKEWIRNHASVLLTSQLRQRNKFKAPEIWMVTGVQLVTEGRVVRAGSSRSVNGTIGASGDPGAALGAPPGTTAIGAEVSHGHGSEANTSYSHEDERVWAAQFMEVKVHFGTEEKKDLKSQGNKPSPATKLTLRLKDIPDLGARGFRGDQQQRADGNGQSLEKIPELVGRIFVDSGGYEDDISSKSGDIEISEESYVGDSGLEEVDWEMYDECCRYLRDE